MSQKIVWITDTITINYSHFFLGHLVHIYMISSFFVFVLQVTCRCDCKLPVAGAEYNPVTKDEYELLLLLNIIEVLVFGHWPYICCRCTQNISHLSKQFPVQLWIWRKCIYKSWFTSTFPEYLLISFVIKYYCKKQLSS